MATPDSNPTVKITPGKNEKVNNVINMEDLLRRVTGGARDIAGTGSAASLDHADKLSTIQRIAADLETNLRELRAKSLGSSDNPSH
jgi:hypothetical protein